MGVDSSITRSTDTTLNPSDRPKKVQSFYGNGSDVVVISNHINAGGGDGAEVIYALRNNDKLSKKIVTELENAGQNIRKYYQRRLPSNPARDYYYIHRDTPNNETVIVEYGFADSTGDDVNQIKNNWEELAEAVVKAVTEYVGGTYVAPLGSNYYTVLKGESLWSIAKKLGVTVNELKEANNLQSNLLSVGQNLIIPKEEEEMGDKITYTVKSGDSLYKIANMYKTTVNKLKEINNLTTNTLSIGQVLTISEGAKETGNTYTVKAGDSLWSIAKKFNTTIDNLKDVNNLISENLSIGQVLQIPTNDIKTQTNNNYIVSKGDSLYSIANKYGISVDELKNANNLSSNLLSIGQVLQIPEVNAYKTYTIKSGDNLYSIARDNNTTVSALVELNNLSTNVLSIGQKLLIP